jgi:PKD repeat protein
MATPGADCGEGETYYEKELYDIGTLRETDPYEWKNLAADPAYQPVINYLDNFFPDSIFYKQRIHKAVISNGVIPCFIGNSGKLKLRVKLYSPTGSVISGADLTDNYTFQWTNNLTSATFNGSTYNFSLNTIPASTYSAIDRILFYLHVYDQATGDLVAFDTKTFYLNPANTPSISYTASVTGMTVNIVDYIITGSYKTSKWDFGDGTIVDDYLPAAHTYSDPGTYVIKNTVSYGNGCSTVSSKTITVLEPEKLQGVTVHKNETQMQVYPNPANDFISISFDPTYSCISVSVLNMLGQELIHLEDVNRIGIASLPQGQYLLKLEHDKGYEMELFTIVR